MPPPSPTPAPIDPAAEPAASTTAMSGIYLPVSGLSNPALLRGFVDRAAAAGLDTVVVEAKDAAGAVLYQSQNALARTLGAADDAAYHPATVSKAIRDAKMVPAARLHAFRDSLTPVSERALGVRYYDTESLWFDNNPAQGGKPWLNPCSAEAQQYITALASELVTAGFEIILLDSVQFPSGLGLEKAGYGIASPDRAAVLDAFIAQVRKAVEDAGGQLIVCLPADALPTGDESADALLAVNNQLVYGASPAARMQGPTMLTLSNDPETSKQILARARAAGKNAEWLGLLPAYRNDGSLIESSVLLSGLDPAGYLLYNPQGNYQLQP